jgi:ABC-type multidrug transport system ATPase subunit
MVRRRRRRQARNNACNDPHFDALAAGYSGAMNLSTSPALLHIEGLRFSWPDEAPLFAGLDARVGAGVTLLDGGIASGKTTLLRLIAGALEGGGRIALQGRAAGRRDVAFLDVADERLDALTAAGLLAALRERHGACDTTAWERHVEGFGLRPHLAKPMCQLSTGTRRKAGLAATLATRAVLTLLDEPAAGLDAASRRHLCDALLGLASEHDRAWLVVAGQGLEPLAHLPAIELPARESA